jgi:hypothetical protein
MMLVYMRKAYCGPILIIQGLSTQQEKWNPSQGQEELLLEWLLVDKQLVYGAVRNQVATAG